MTRMKKIRSIKEKEINKKKVDVTLRPERLKFPQENLPVDKPTTHPVLPYPAEPDYQPQPQPNPADKPPNHPELPDSKQSPTTPPPRL